LIEIIGSISKRVDSCDNTGVIGHDCANAPSIVGVVCNYITLVVCDGNNVALQVLKEIVCVIIIDNTADRILIIVEGNKRIVSPGLTKNLCAVKSVLVLNTVDRLARSDAVCVVSIGIAVKRLELATLFPSESMTQIRNGITLCVVGDGLITNCGRLILPDTVAVGIRPSS
jgi:hypothetical protein